MNTIPMTGDMVLMVSGSAVLPIVNTQNLYYLHVKQLLKETGLFVLRLLIFKKIPHLIDID